MGFFLDLAGRDQLRIGGIVILGCLSNQGGLCSRGKGTPEMDQRCRMIYTKSTLVQLPVFDLWFV